jgi:hypothetical protein
VSGRAECYAGPANRGFCDSTGASTDFNTDQAGPAGRLALDPVLASSLGKPGPPAGPSCLTLPVVSRDTEVQVDVAALPLDLVDLALAVVLTASLERQHLRVPRKLLQRAQHLLNGHSAKLA